jgi:hypothetical protein
VCILIDFFVCIFCFKMSILRPSSLRCLRSVPRRLLQPPLPPSRGLAWTPASAAFPRRTAAELYAEILDLTKAGGDYTVHNYGR